jgi:hypothetical protein
VRLDHLLSKESSSQEHLSRSFDHQVGPLRWIPSWCTGYSAARCRRRMELSGSPPSTDWCRRPLFRFEGVRKHSLFSAINAPPEASSSARWTGESASPARRPGLQRPTTQAPLENCIASTSIFVLPSYKEPTVDALASTTDEGRVWLRKATGSCLESFDPWMSEWGNPAPVMGCYSRLNT